MSGDKRDLGISGRPVRGAKLTAADALTKHFQPGPGKQRGPKKKASPPPEAVPAIIPKRVVTFADPLESVEVIPPASSGVDNVLDEPDALIEDSDTQCEAIDGAFSPYQVFRPAKDNCATDDSDRLQERELEEDVELTGFWNDSVDQNSEDLSESEEPLPIPHPRSAPQVHSTFQPQSSTLKNASRLAVPKTAIATTQNSSSITSELHRFQLPHEATYPYLNDVPFSFAASVGNSRVPGGQINFSASWSKAKLLFFRKLGVTEQQEEHAQISIMCADSPLSPGSQIWNMISTADHWAAILLKLKENYVRVYPSPQFVEESASTKRKSPKLAKPPKSKFPIVVKNANAVVLKTKGKVGKGKNGQPEIETANTTTESTNDNRELPKRKLTATAAVMQIHVHWRCEKCEQICYNPKDENGEEVMHETLNRGAITTWGLIMSEDKATVKEMPDSIFKLIATEKTKAKEAVNTKAASPTVKGGEQPQININLQGSEHIFQAARTVHQPPPAEPPQLQPATQPRRSAFSHKDYPSIRRFMEQLQTLEEKDRVIRSPSASSMPPKNFPLLGVQIQEGLGCDNIQDLHILLAEAKGSNQSPSQFLLALLLDTEISKDALPKIGTVSFMLNALQDGLEHFHI